MKLYEKLIVLLLVLFIIYLAIDVCRTNSDVKKNGVYVVAKVVHIIKGGESGVVYQFIYRFANKQYNGSYNGPLILNDSLFFLNISKQKPGNYTFYFTEGEYLSNCLLNQKYVDSFWYHLPICIKDSPSLR